LILLALVAVMLSWQAERPAQAALSALSGKTVAQVSAGSWHTCAVTTDGLLACWGDNTHGQLGNGSVDDRTVPGLVTLAGPLVGKEFTQVSAGTSHTCAVTTDGELACWGLQTDGRLGNGATTAADVTAPLLVAVTATPLDAKTVASVSAGQAHSCATATDGTTACWGANASGQLGDGTTSASAVPAALSLAGTPLEGATVAAVETGADHTCATTDTGTLACWGANASGQLGDGTTTDRNVPTAVAVSGTPLDGVAVASLALGDEHTCAASDVGIATCWGQQELGRLGDGVATAGTVTTPTAVTVTGTPLSGADVTGVTAGANFSCAVTADADVACWGDNTVGRLGDGTTTQQLAPTAIVTTGTPLATLTVASIASGGGHSCAVATNGDVTCWGANADGELGDGSTQARSLATSVVTDPTFQITSISGQRAGIVDVARAGDQLALSGSWWSASLAPGAFEVTVAGEVASHTLATDADGALTGTVTVPGAAAAGAGAVVVTQGLDSTSLPLTVLSDREISLTPSSGRPGTTVSVAGEQFDPDAAVQIVGVTDLSGPVLSADAPVTATVSSAGEVPATDFVVTDAATIAVLVRETAPGGNPATDFASATFTIDPVTVFVDSVTGQRAGVDLVARAGDTVVVSGSGWPSNLVAADFVAQWCDDAGENCEPAVSTTLTTEGAGALSGGVEVPSGSTAGDRALKVVNNGRDAVVPMTILDNRTVTLLPIAAGGGTTVSVSAADFDGDAAVTLQGVRTPDGSIASSDAPITATTTELGVLEPIDYTVNDPQTIAVMVVEDAPEGDPLLDRAFGAFTVLPVAGYVEEVIGQRAGVTTHARAGDQIIMGGEGWAPDLTDAGLTAWLCLPDGSSCGTPLADTLATDETGVLTGTVDVPVGAVTGARSLKVSSINGEILTPVTVLADRTASTSTSSVIEGNAFSVSGSGFDVGAQLEIRGAVEVDGSTITYSTDLAVPTTSDANGAFAAVDYPVVDADTTALVVIEVAPEGGPDDFAATPVTVIVPTYSLGLSTLVSGDNPNASTVSFGAITTPLAPTPLPGALNQIEVVDDRQSAYGWSLTASLSDFSGAGGATIDAGQLAVTPSCVGTSTSAPGYLAGTAGQTFGDLVQLCSKDEQVGSGGTTSGTYTVDAPLVLTVPAFQAADSYAAVLTITLA
jgi:alpha-tubulin suppressor-like RCC1 family protein